MLPEKYINNYAKKSFMRSSSPLHEKRSSQDDVAQQVHLELVESLGPDYLQKIGDQLVRGAAFKDKESPEHKALVKAVSRVIGQRHWTLAKRRQRQLPRTLPLTDEIADPKDRDSSVLASELRDLAIDLSQGLGRFSDQEKQILALSMEGWTVREIDAKLGMDFRRVAESLRYIKKRLKTILS